MNWCVVKEEPNDGEISTNGIAQGSDEEMSIDIAQAELKIEDHVVKEEPMNGVFSANANTQESDNQDKEIESRMRRPSNEFDRIIYLMSLLESFKRVAVRRMSWLWHAPVLILPCVSCPDCGLCFQGMNRMIALVKHIQSNHSCAAIELMITCMDRYGMLIRHMDRVLKCEIKMLVERHL